jgi:hypothetical protein
MADGVQTLTSSKNILVISGRLINLIILLAQRAWGWTAIVCAQKCDNDVQ